MRADSPPGAAFGEGGAAGWKPVPEKVSSKSAPFPAPSSSVPPLPPPTLLPCLSLAMCSLPSALAMGQPPVQQPWASDAPACKYSQPLLRSPQPASPPVHPLGPKKGPFLPHSLPRARWAKRQAEGAPKAPLQHWRRPLPCPRCPGIYTHAPTHQCWCLGCLPCAPVGPLPLPLGLAGIEASIPSFAMLPPLISPPPAQERDVPSPAVQSDSEVPFGLCWAGNLSRMF